MESVSKESSMENLKRMIKLMHNPVEIYGEKHFDQVFIERDMS
jgi:hypothetical protein